MDKPQPWRAWPLANAVGWAIWLLALILNPAQANTVVVVTSAPGGASSELVDAMQAELRKSPAARVQILDSGIPGSGAKGAMVLPSDTLLVIAVGANAARAVLASTDIKTDILCVLLPRSTFESLSLGGKQISGRRTSAIFIDQPPARQLELIRQILPGRTRVGLVLGPETSRDVDGLRTHAESRNMTLVTERANRDAELYPALQQVLTASDVLLALPDPYIIHADSAQNLLLTSFRWRIPVVGYSVSYVRAGALGAVFSSPAQIGADAADVVRQVVRGQALTTARYSRYFSIALNRQVARSLSLSIPDETVLQERLQRMERQE